MTEHERVQAMLLCFGVLGIIAIAACVYCIVLLTRIKDLLAHLGRPVEPQTQTPRNHVLGVQRSRR